MVVLGGKRVWGKFGLNALRRRCSRSRARARSNKRGLGEQRPNERDAKNVRSWKQVETSPLG